MTMHILRSWTYGVTVGTAVLGAVLFAGCSSDEPDPQAPADAGPADAVVEADAEPSDGGADVERTDDGALGEDDPDADVDAGPCSVDGWCETEIVSPNLEAVWGSGPNDVWAVGWFGTIMHWDGTQWSQIESGTEWPLFGIWGSGPNDVWAVGRYGTVLHWDGTSFSREQSITTFELDGVWGNGQGDVWVTVRDEYAILHKDAAGVWSRQPYGSFVSLNGISGAGQSSVWVWAKSGVFPWRDGSSVLEDITTDSSFPWWSSTLPWDYGTTSIANVWVAGPSDLWILTERGDIYNWKQDPEGNITAVQSRVPPSGSAQDGYLKLTSIWGSSSTDVWASGQLGRIVHLYDKKWSLSSTAVHGRIFDCTLSLWGAGADDVWAVGKCADGHGVALRRHR